MLECFLNYPAVTEEHPFALDYQTIAEAQINDAALLQSLASKPNQFGRFLMNQEANIICYIPGPNQPFKICIPDAMLDNIIRFYYLALNHIGITRLAIPSHFILIPHIYNQTLKEE